MSYKCFIFLLSLFLMQPVFSDQHSTLFSKMVFFGDSLSDNGNFYRDVLYFVPKDPPYYKGRFSNGQVWSEYVDEYFSTHYLVESTNYAVGGQTAYFHNPFEGYLPYSLAMSRENYILHSLFTDRSRTLFIIWIGANDYLLGIPDIEQLTTDVTNAIKATVEDLIYHGGVNFLLLNLPDLSKTPYGKTIDYNDSLKSAIVAHNAKLDKVVAGLKDSYNNINIHLYDINHFFDDAIQHREEYNKKYNTHIANVSDSCWSGGYSLRSIKVTEALIAKKLREHTQLRAENVNAHSEELVHLVASSPPLLEAFIVSNHNDTGVTRCENPDDYLFWDKVHPGSVPHSIIGKTLIEFIDANYQALK